MKTTRHKLTPCLNCGKELDAASGLEHDSTPSPGDMTVCLYCHHVMVYESELTLRNPTDAEVVEIAGDPSLLIVMQALEKYDG